MKVLTRFLLVFLLISSVTLAQSSRKGGLTGWDYFKQKRYNVALELLLKDARLYPKSHEIQDGVGWCYFFLSDLDKAEQHFRRALELKKDYRYSKMGLESVATARLGPIVRAEGLLTQGRYTEAVSAFTALINKKPRYDNEVLNRAYQGRGMAHYYLGLYQKALRDLQKANRLVPKDPVTSARLGFVELARKKYSQADIAFEYALKNGSKDVQVYLSHAWSAYYAGNARAALRRFEKACRSFPESWGAVYGLAWAHIKTGNDQKAAELFRRALNMSANAATVDLLNWIRKESEYGDLLVDYGFALMELGQYFSAQQIFRSAATQVDRLQMRLGDALCSLNQGDNLGALQTAKSVLDRGEDPQRDIRIFEAGTGVKHTIEVSASSVAGWAHLRLGDLKEAAKMFEKALDLQGQWAAAHVGLGYVRIAQNRYPDAELQFQQALTILPTYGPASDGLAKVQTWRFEDYNRAWTLVNAGDLAAARAVFESLRQDPARRFPPARLDLVDYSLGHIARLESRPRQAAALFRKAIQRNPQLVAAKVGLGWALVNLKEYDEAVRLLLPLVKVLPRDPEPRRLLVRAWTEWGREEEAFKRLPQWVKEFPSDPELNDRYGRMLIEKNRHIEARIAFTAVLNANPEYVSENELKGWLERFEAFHPLYGTLGWALYYRGKYDKSAKNFEMAVKFEPGETLHLKGLALAHSALKDFDAAEKYADAWIETLEKNTAARAKERAMHMTLGWDLYGAGLYKRALARFRRVEKMDGSKNAGVDLLSAMGWTWLRLKKELRAREYFLKALAREPRLETALQGLEAVNSATRK